MENEVFSSYYFTVEIDGIQTDRFFSCEGLEVESNVYEVEEGGFNTSTHKHIGRTRYPNLILKKGINSNNELINWFQRNESGRRERKTLAVILMHSSGVEIKRWDFFRVFPCRWKVKTLDAQDNSFLVEIIELAHD
ncbi:phage tail protein [Spirochaetia bacterium]|nr:phage tail protein [Spirochaetia bacterium]